MINLLYHDLPRMITLSNIFFRGLLIFLQLLLAGCKIKIWIINNMQILFKKLNWNDNQQINMLIDHFTIGPSQPV